TLDHISLQHLHAPGLARPRRRTAAPTSERSRWYPLPPGCSRGAQSEHGLGVLVTDLLAIGLREIERLDHRDGGADVAPALLLVERTVRREQHMIGTEERQPANGRRARRRARCRRRSP